MLQNQPNNGDLLKLPEGTVIYRMPALNEGGVLLYCQSIHKPVLAIYIDQLNERMSKIVFEDQIRYVYTDTLCQLGINDVNQANWHI